MLHLQVCLAIRESLPLLWTSPKGKGGPFLHLNRSSCSTPGRNGRGEHREAERLRTVSVLGGKGRALDLTPDVAAKLLLTKNLSLLHPSPFLSYYGQEERMTLPL